LRKFCFHELSKIIIYQKIFKDPLDNKRSFYKHPDGKPRTIIKKYTIPILFNYQDSKLWIITGCGNVSKIAIPKNEYCPDQKRCIPLVKVYLRDYLVMGIVTMNLLKKTLLSVLLKNYYQFISKIIKLITNI
tara:strand:+ start:1047 stop:1442 length:396 start_codon:yes stop_codon:yes gene_type:complete